MANKRPSKVPQPPPVAFRPGPELEQRVAAFARVRQLGLAETFRDLAALAVVGLDARYFDVVNQMAAGMEGRNAFVRAVLQVDAQLRGAERVTGPDGWTETGRAQFVADAVVRTVGASGGRVDQSVLHQFAAQFRPESTGGPSRDANAWPPEEAGHGEPIRVRRRVGQ